VAVTRSTAVINEDITLNMTFTKNGVLNNPYQIVQVQIYDPSFNLIQTIDSENVTNVSAGVYSVTMSGVSTEGSYTDKWTYIAESGAGYSYEFGSIIVYDVQAVSDTTWQSVIGEMVKNKVSNVVSPSGTDLYEKIAQAALEVTIDIPEISSAEYNRVYTTTVYPAPAIIPDPVLQKDWDFVDLVVLQTAYNIVQESTSQGASEGIRVRSGDDEIDTNVGVASKNSVLMELRRQYNEAKKRYAFKITRDYLSQVIPPGSVNTYGWF